MGLEWETEQFMFANNFQYSFQGWGFDKFHEVLVDSIVNVIESSDEPFLKCKYMQNPM